MPQEKKPGRFSLENNEGYRTARARLIEIQLELINLEGSRRELISASGDEQVKLRREARQNVILTGGKLEDVPSEGSWREDVNELSARIREYRKAEETQKRRIAEGEWAASKQICEIAAPIYEKIMRDEAKAFVEWGKCRVKEIELRAALIDEGVRFDVYIAHLPSRLGDPREFQSSFGLRLQEYLENKYLSAADIPWLDIWNRRGWGGFKVRAAA